VTTLEELRGLGYFLLPIPAGRKEPPPAGWLNRVEPYEIPAGANVAIGVRGEIAILITNDGRSTSWATEQFGQPHVRSVRGAHWYSRARKGQANESNRETPVGTMELHVRSKYALIPPSIHPSGAAYEWVLPLPKIADLPECPDLRELWHPSGSHHSKLLAMSSAKARAGASEELVAAELRTYRDAHLPDPAAHPDRELGDMARSAYAKYGHAPAPRPPPPASAEEKGEADAKLGGPPLRIPMGDRGRVELFADRLEFVTPNRKGEDRSPVIDGHLEALSRHVLDGESYYRVRFDGDEFVAQAGAVRKRLDRAGAILDARRAADATSAVLRVATRGRVLEGHAAFGVYCDKDGKLALDDRPLPLHDEQRDVSDQLAEAAAHPVSRADVQAYVDLVSNRDPFFHLYEILPAFGLSASAPFALELRKRGVLVPHLMHVSPDVGGLGKSTNELALSESLYGRRQDSCDSIESKYRLGAIFDAGGTPFTLEESEHLSPKLAPALKEAAERAVVTKRGLPELGMLTYLSRGVGFLNGNAFPLKSTPTRARFLVVEYDVRMASVRHSAKERRRLKEVTDRLRPVGWELVRFAIRRFGTIDGLLGEIESARKEIEDASRVEFEDARRGQAWAVVWVGLGIWEEYAASQGVEWKRPTLTEFVSSVVRTVESSTYESVDRAAFAFERWFTTWRVKNTRHVHVEGGLTVVTEGEGELFQPGDLDGRNGYWIREPLLDLYLRETPPELRFDGFAPLSRALADAFGLDRARATGADGRGAVRKFQGRDKRCCFLPDEAAPGEIVEKSGSRGSLDNLDPSLPSENTPPGPATAQAVARGSDGSESASQAEAATAATAVEAPNGSSPSTSEKRPQRGAATALPRFSTPPNGTREMGPPRVDEAAAATRAYLSERPGGSEVQPLREHLVSRGFTTGEADAGIGQVCGDGSTVRYGELVRLKGAGA
jgi:hypothetical protein